VSLRYRHEYAADFPMASTGQQGQTTREVAHPHRAGTHRARPRSARFEPVKD
jgi:hypothetical protein